MFDSGPVRILILFYFLSTKETMSLSAIPVETLLADDPRIDMDQYAAYVIERSAGDITYRSYQADNTSTSSIVFNTRVPSRDTVVASKVYVKIPVRIRIQGNPFASGGNPVPIDEDVALRFAPFIQATSSLSMTLNGKTFSEDIGQYYNSLMRYCNTVDENAYDFSTFPSFQDTYGEYYNKQIAAPTAGNLQGSLALGRSPMGALNDTNSPYSPVKRKGWLREIATRTVAVANEDVTYEFTYEEIVPLSPLFWGHKEVKGLVGLDTLNLSFTLNPLGLPRFVSSSRYGLPNGAQPVQNNDLIITTDFNGDAMAEFIYLKPRANVPTPRINRYPYSNIKYFTTRATGPVTPPADVIGNFANQSRAAPQTLTFTNIHLDGVPKRIYIFLRERDSDLRYYTTDTCAYISNLSLNIGNRSGLLGEASPEALYRMAVKNGCKTSWTDWRNRVGSVLCLDFGSDIPLDLTDAPGALRQLQFYFTVTWQSIKSNRSPADLDQQAELNYMCYAVIVYEGMVTTMDGQVLIESNDVSVLDVIDSEKIRRIPYDALMDYTGGSYNAGSFSKFIDRSKAALGKAKKFAQEKVLPKLDKALPYVQRGLDVASMIPIPELQSAAIYGKKAADFAQKAIPTLMAMGYTEEQLYKLLKKSGGARMSGNKLKQRAIQY